MPAGSYDLVTGASGMLGSHIAEQLVARAAGVRASCAGEQDGLPGRARRGVGPRRPDRSVGVRAGGRGGGNRLPLGREGRRLGSLARVSDLLHRRHSQPGRGRRARGARFLHISSTSAYGHPADGGPPIDETAPMGRNVWVWDPYTHSKVESEKALWSVSEARRLAVTVIRPSWLYGERDRTTTARIVDRLRRGQVRIIGRGDNPLSAVYAGTVAEAALLAARDPGSAGEAYNITNQGPITQAEFFNLFAAALGLPPVARHVPYSLVYAVSFMLEAVGRARRRARPPLISRYATWLMGRNLEYSTAKAESRLGWRPGLTYPESIGRTVRWYLDHEAS